MKKRQIKVVLSMALTFMIYICDVFAAQGQDVLLYGEVKDNLTGEYLPNSTIRVLNAGDSSVVSIFTAMTEVINGDIRLSNNRVKTSQFDLSVPRGKDYILETHFPGYAKKYTNVNISNLNKKTGVYEVGTIYLDYEVKQLGELTVTASKVKFYHKGDTLVYNADAFVLPEGSMLDALISQLPGVELKQSGEIYVNGRKVESLLLNGRSFFNDNRQLMLQNLGSYAVKDVQVYDKLGIASEIAGTNLGDSEYVMDVKLKKEYMVGVNMNIEGGYGTSDRYLGRLFAMAFTKHNQYAAYFNANNLNESRKPGQDTDWEPEDMPSGVRRTIDGGFDYNLKPEGNHWEINGNVNASHSNVTDGTDVTRENYILGGTTYTNKFNRQKNKSLNLSTNHKLYYKTQGYGITFEPNVKYSKWENNTTDTEATFDDNFNDVTIGFIEDIYSGNNRDALKAMLNRKVETDRRKGWGLSAGSSVWQAFTMPNTTDLLTVKLLGSYDKRHDERFDRFDINFGESQANGDHADRYYRNYPDFKSNVGAELGYNYVVNQHLKLGFKYKYNHDYAKQNSMLFDLMLDYWSDDDASFGHLPSESTLFQGLDANNSYLSRLEQNRHTAEVQLVYRNKYLQLNYTFPVNFLSQKYNYIRGTVADTTIHRKTILLDFGKQRISWNKGDKEILWDWNLKSQAPNLLNLVDFTDATNPLYITKGAKDLKNALLFDTELSFNKEMSRGKRIRFQGHFSAIKNALARGITYDNATGVQTSRMYNVNGNWTADGAIAYRFMPLPYVMAGFATSYAHVTSVDLIGNGGTELFHNRVFQNSISENIVAQCMLGENAMLGIDFKGQYARISSNQAEFHNQNTWNFKTALKGTFELPYNFSLSTDFTVYNRRGFVDNVLNTDNFIWNARLSYKALKGQLLLMVDGYDILHDLSNVSHTINAQARTETIRTVLPRYVMFHAQWKFDFRPTPPSKRKFKK